MCGRYVFSLKKYTSRKVIDIVHKLGYTHINVRQGYSACSSLVSDDFIISADKSILTAAEKCGIDCLEISAGGIELEGYDTGFIGGCAGVCNRTVYFFGDVMTHPDGKSIREFLKAHGYICVSLGEGVLKDHGGIKFLKSISQINGVK